MRSTAIVNGQAAGGVAERRIGAVRLLVLFSLLPLLWGDIISPESRLALIWLTVFIAAYILTTLFVRPHLPQSPRQDLTLAIDILATAALVFFTGGIKSSLLVLLYLPLLAAAVRFNLRQTFLAAIAISAIVVWMWSIAEGGLPSLGPIAARVGLFTFGSLFVALFFGTLAQETRLSKERAALNRTLDEKLAEATAQLRRRLAELEVSYDLSRRLASTTDTDAVLGTIADAAQHQTQAPFSAVFLYERLGEGLSLASARGMNAEDAAPIMHACAARLAEGATGTFEIQAPEGIGWTRGVCAPITAGGRLIGALSAGGDEHWAAPVHAATALAGIADQGGVAVERAHLLEDLQRLALADPTARLYPREQLDRILRDEVKRAAQLEAPFALMKVRVAISGAGGALSGDTASDLLEKRIASKILESARRVDVVARGDRGEFFVLLPMTDQAAAERLAHELRQRLAEDPAAQRLAASPGLDIRIGIATFPQDATTGPELSYAADSTLDAAAPSRPAGRGQER